MNNELVALFNEAWSWTRQSFVAITAINPFGHMILRDAEGHYAHCDPEMLTLTQVALGDEALFEYMAAPDVREIWEAKDFIEQAESLLGKIDAGRIYSWKIAPVLGGDFIPENMTTMALHEHIRFTGHIADQLKDVQDGQTIQLKVVE
jgi:hypothetical protein